MSAGIRCWECRRLVPENELEVGRDGRPLCCCCRLKEIGEKLAERDRGGRSPEPAQKASELPSEIAVATPRDPPPPEPEPSGWASVY
jgi:hypothetical protein